MNLTQQRLAGTATLSAADRELLSNAEPAGEALWLPDEGRALIVDGNFRAHWYAAPSREAASRIGHAKTAVLWFDADARAILEEAGLGIGDIIRDIEELADGTVTREQLLEKYSNGADEMARDGWRAYVRCLAAAIKLEPEAEDQAAEPSSLV